MSSTEVKEFGKVSYKAMSRRRVVRSVIEIHWQYEKNVMQRTPFRLHAHTNTMIISKTHGIHSRHTEEWISHVTPHAHDRHASAMLSFGSQRHIRS